MAQPSTREELKQYCLRKLGAPVIEINVDDSQLEDRIDEAISLFTEYHFDGVERRYYKHQVTQEEIDNHEHTTTQRYIIRPAFVYTHKNMGYDYLIKNIRYQMIHGPGCKGPRKEYKFEYDEVSEDSFLSNSNSIVSEHSEHSEAARL